MGRAGRHGLHESCETQNSERSTMGFEELCGGSFFFFFFVLDLRVGDAAAQLDKLSMVG